MRYEPGFVRFGVFGFGLVFVCLVPLFGLCSFPGSHLLSNLSSIKVPCASRRTQRPHPCQKNSKGGIASSGSAAQFIKGFTRIVCTEYGSLTSLI